MNAAEKLGMSLELSVIMPAYNEERSIPAVVCAWMAALDRLKIDYEFLAYDDGSVDGTGILLRELAARHPRLVVVSHANRGHGPTILSGYRDARGEWVFQMDSDGQVGPDAFEGLWSRRDRFDFLIGVRRTRGPAVARRVVTLASRVLVWMLFGRGISDVNSPYRLMRRSCLEAMLPAVPPNAFAPNVILSGLAARRKLRLYETGVAHVARRTGSASLAGWRLWKTALRCFAETVRAAWANRPGARG